MTNSEVVDILMNAGLTRDHAHIVIEKLDGALVLEPEMAQIEAHIIRTPSNSMM